MLFLKLGDIRRASFIPRDPRSFAVSEQNLVEASQAVAVAQILHGPESTTLQSGKTRGTGELPLLANVCLPESLILDSCTTRRLSRGASLF